MKLEQKTSVDIVELRGNTFASISALFELLSFETLAYGEFSNQTTSLILYHVKQVVIGEQRLACFIPQVHHVLTLLDLLDNQTDIHTYVTQIHVISKILDNVAEKMHLPAHYHTDALRVIDHDVYLADTFDATLGAAVSMQLTVQLQCIFDKVIANQED